MGWLKKIFGGDDASSQTSSQAPQSAQPTESTQPAQSQSQPQPPAATAAGATTIGATTAGTPSAGTPSAAASSSAAAADFPPLTDDRLDASIDRLGWGEGTAFKNRDQGGGFWLLFDGVAALVTIPQPTAGRPTISVMAVIGEDKPIPKNRMAEALAWVNLQNNQTRFGTCLLGESINGLSLRVSCPVVLPLGATDAQLDSWLYNAVSCALQSALAANKYFFADSDKT